MVGCCGMAAVRVAEVRNNSAAAVIGISERGSGGTSIVVSISRARNSCWI